MRVIKEMFDPVLCAVAIVVIIVMAAGFVVMKHDIDNPQPTVQQSYSDGGNISVGPKLDFEPALNMSTGQIEIGPSIHPGPRLNF